MRIICTIAFGMLTGSGFSQVNLIPNPSFEEFSTCPYTAGQISVCESWQNVRGSVDYFHVCGENGWATPANNWGYQRPLDGEAYVNVAHWAFALPNAREFVGVELHETLITNQQYILSFYVSLIDSARYAIRNIGAALTNDRPSNNTHQLLSIEPQVRYVGIEYLDDKDDWVRIEGSFIAQGFEKYLTIGNFDDDEATDTLYVGPPMTGTPDWRSSGYYIDMVTLVLDTSYHVGLVEGPRINFGLWPNPATDAITIETDGRPGTAVELYDVAGRMVLSSSVRSSKHTIGIGHLPAGVYVAVLREKGVAVARRKLVKQ